MKKLTTLTVLVALFTLVSINVNAQKTATASGSATIITPIQISKTVDMNFGNIVSTTAEGTVILSTNDSRTNGGGVILPTATPGSIKSAQFKVTGLPAATYAITLPGDDDITISNGSESMSIKSFTSTPSSTGTLSSSGEQIVKVGATLNVLASQAAGTYTGSFSVTVAYN